MRLSSALAIAALLALLACASLALAAEGVTRASYKAEVEPICQTDAKANEKILGSVRAEVKKGRLKQAGAAFLKAAAALRSAYGQIEAVPQPAADESRLAKWLSYVKEEVSLFQAGGRDLKAGQKSKAQTVVVKLTHNANLANDEVLPFGFRYCKLEPSKFT
jgi:hypothetical protein